MEHLSKAQIKLILELAPLEVIVALDKEFEELNKNNNVEILVGYNLVKIEGDKFVESIVIVKEGKEQIIPVSATFLFFICGSSFGI